MAGPSSQRALPLHATHACWLNQIEIWFSILTRRALQGASFTSPRQLRDAIDAFIAAYNSTAQPFEWKKRQVVSTQLQDTYAEAPTQVTVTNEDDPGSSSWTACQASGGPDDPGHAGRRGRRRGDRREQ